LIFNTILIRAIIGFNSTGPSSTEETVVLIDSITDEAGTIAC